MNSRYVCHYEHAAQEFERIAGILRARAKDGHDQAADTLAALAVTMRGDCMRCGLPAPTGATPTRPGCTALRAQESAPELMLV